jgi:hypothetical protein
LDLNNSNYRLYEESYNLMLAGDGGGGESGKMDGWLLSFNEEEIKSGHGNFRNK